MTSNQENAFENIVYKCGLDVISLSPHSFPIECSSHDGADALRVVTIDRRLFHSLIAQP